MLTLRAILVLTVLSFSVSRPEAAHAQNPTAYDDYSMTDSHHSVEIDVLSNDQPGWSGAPLDPDTVSIVSGPVSGSASVDPVTGRITYEPVPGTWGVADIEYGALDTEGNPTNVAVLEVWVMHNPPTAQDDYAMTYYDTSVVINLLANDQSGTAAIDPDSVTITSQPQHGTVSVGAGGEVTYTPSGVESVSDSFEYTICDEDGVESQPAQVEIWVMNNIPSISGFTNWQASAGYWYFEGYVNDEHPETCRVDFGGILQGHDPVTPQSDGKFSFVVQLGSGMFFAPATAVATDEADQVSQEAETIVYSY
jgi:hypothetical protein